MITKGYIYYYYIILELNFKYLHEEGDHPPDPSIFRQLVGSLNYLTITRLDISFAVQQVIHFMEAPLTTW